MSTPCSAAIFRTSGDERVRSLSSNEFPLECAGTFAGVAGGLVATAETGVDSLFGGGPPLGDAEAAAATAGTDELAAAVAAVAAPFSVSSLATIV
jgi:hypothetical protein